MQRLFLKIQLLVNVGTFLLTFGLATNQITQLVDVKSVTLTKINIKAKLAHFIEHHDFISIKLTTLLHIKKPAQK